MKDPSRPGLEVTPYIEHSRVFLNKSYLMAFTYLTLLCLRNLVTYILDTLLLSRILHTL